MLAILGFASLHAQASWGLGLLVPRPRDVLAIEPGRAVIDTRIRENIARTRVHQEFFNPNPRPLEVDFFFPLPPGASVTDFVLYVNGKPQRGEILEKDKARRIYEDIVRRMKDPGVLEWAEWNLFRVAVFPVPAGSSQTIEIEFSQPLSAQQGIFRYVFPMGGPDPAMMQGGRTSRRHGKAKQLDVEFTVSIEAPRKLGNVYSPTHKIETRDVGENSTEVKIVPTSETDWSKHFVLLYDYREKDVAVTLLASRHPPEAGYFCLMLSPPVKSQEQTSVPLDLVFVLDTSGSMSESGKIDQARRAVNYCLNQLNPQDCFALVRFATETETYRDQLVHATSEEIARAKHWLENLRAAGGTNIADALDVAIKVAASEPDTTASHKRRKLVLFATDGLPTVGITATDKILERIEQGTRGKELRIFAFGVGHDVNTHLLDQIAERTRACADYVAPEEDLELPVSRLFDKVARPALSSLELTFEGGEVFDFYPKVLPDLFFGEQLTVFGRYKKSGPVLIRLRGNIGEAPAQFDFEKSLPEEARGNEPIETLWATRKVGYLLDALRDKPDSKEIRDEIVSLAKRYGIVTPFTSYLVVEDKPELFPQSAPSASAHDRPLVEPPQHLTIGRRAMGMKAGVALAPLKALRAESGEAAIAAAKAVRSMKEAKSVPSGLTTDEVPLKWIAGRGFVRVGDMWMEEGTVEAKEVVRVRNYSQAYFELVHMHPELRAIFRLSDKIRVKLGQAIVEFAEDGLEQLPEDLSKLVDAKK
jgi:Ca-activated chloride channel family protein